MTDVLDVCRRAARVAPEIARLTSEVKNRALHAMAAALEDRSAELIEHNAGDVERALSDGMSKTLVDRLTLTESRLTGMSGGLKVVAAQDDPVGQVVEGWKRPNGLSIERVRAPLGVVAVIYEARPNVTADVAGLCLKSGNAGLLRGSSNATASNRAIVDVLRAAAMSEGVPADAIQLVPGTSRSSAVELMQAKGLVDLLIPRGGKELIKSIEDNATVPFIIDGDGNCHIFVDASADPKMATAIVLNAKTQRPSVCNAAETLLVHTEIADKWLAGALDLLAGKGVEIRGDEKVRALWPDALPATDEDWSTEYLDLVLAVRIVDSLDDAIAHVNNYGTSNAEAIVTGDLRAARRFSSEVDSGSVLVNASTRFSDGGEFGFGAEIGISTQKLHARGPMGLQALTSERFVVWGEGQIRE